MGKACVLCPVFKVGGSLGEQPVGGDADVHGKAEPGVNLVLQPVGKVHRIAVERGGACHVAEGPRRCCRRPPRAHIL